MDGVIPSLKTIYGKTEQKSFTFPRELNYSYLHKEGSKMAQNKHKYRVSIYLGKEMYERFEKEAEMMNISIATLTKIILATGYQLATNLEKKGVIPNGESK